MYLIAGLGNPGRQYDMTRHNIGFEVIDYMADQYNVKVKKLKFKGLYADTVIAGEKAILLKPQTYMNLSGESVRDFADFYKIPAENIIIINDDINLAAGRLRIRAKGSAGGHNGLKSIIYQLNSDNFPRIRIGVDSPVREKMDLADFVLARFTKEEIPVLEESIILTKKAVEEIILGGIESAMNKYNR
ncbi:MAG: aminoacyl-tRNA hydrolase [Clostridiales bacterium]|nr:aminoacyl-tRNA hydrolase [Clostridiales bacterium]